MVLLKILGAVIIISSSLGVGYLLNDNMKKRLEGIITLAEFVDYISMNISLYKTPLDDIFRSYSGNYHKKCNFAEKLQGGIYFAAKESGLLLGDDEREVMRSFSEKIGTGTVEESVKLCSYTSSRLRTIEEHLRHDLPDKQRVYRTISLLAGASAVIMMI